MYHSISVIITVASIAFNSVVIRVSADYELILSQKYARNATFNSNVKDTYLENEDNPDADTFTNIGDLNAADFVDDEGNYRFKLIYSNLHAYDYDAEKFVDNDESVTLEWKQTSWLNATIITGYTPINIPTETVTDDRRDFEGLGLSDSDKSFLDGDAHGSATWWNCAGAIVTFNGGMPAFNRQVAMTAALYVYNPTSDPTLDPTLSPSLDPTLGPTSSPSLNPTLNPSADPTLEPTLIPTLNPTLSPVTDCSIFNIDGYLAECSRFPSQISNIKETIINLEQRIYSLENEIEDLRLQINATMNSN